MEYHSDGVNMALQLDPIDCVALGYMGQTLSVARMTVNGPCNVLGATLRIDETARKPLELRAFDVFENAGVISNIYNFFLSREGFLEIYERSGHAVTGATVDYDVSANTIIDEMRFAELFPRGFQDVPAVEIGNVEKVIASALQKNPHFLTDVPSSRYLL